MSEDTLAPVYNLDPQEWEDFAFPFYLYDYPLPIAKILEASPVQVNCKYHEKSTGNKVIIGGAKTDDGRWSASNGVQTITVIDGNNFTLDGTTTNGPSNHCAGIMGTPRNCTGGSVECELRISPDDTEPIFTPTINETDITIGSYELQVSGEELHTLIAAGNDQLFYDIFFIDTEGKRHKELRGAFTISPSITKG